MPGRGSVVHRRLAGQAGAVVLLPPWDIKSSEKGEGRRDGGIQDYVLVINFAVTLWQVCGTATISRHATAEALVTHPSPCAGANGFLLILDYSRQE